MADLAESVEHLTDTESADGNDQKHPDDPHSQEEKDWNKANQKAQFVRDMIVLSHDSERKGTWSGFFSGLGVGILSSIVVFSWAFKSLHSKP